MRITQRMMKSQSVQTENSIKCNKEETDTFAETDGTKKKITEQLKNVDKKSLSSSEKTQLTKKLSEQLKEIDEAIKLSKANEKNC